MYLCFVYTEWNDKIEIMYPYNKSKVATIKRVSFNRIHMSKKQELVLWEPNCNEKTSEKSKPFLVPLWKSGNIRFSVDISHRDCKFCQVNKGAINILYVQERQCIFELSTVHMDGQYRSCERHTFHGYVEIAFFAVGFDPFMCASAHRSVYVWALLCQITHQMYWWQNA